MWIEKNTKEKKKTNEETSKKRSPKNRFNNNNISTRNSFLFQNNSVNKSNQHNDQDGGFKNRKRNGDIITEPVIKDNERITNSFCCTSRSNRHNGISKRVYAPNDILNDTKKKKEESSWKGKKTELLLGTSQEIGVCRNNNEDRKDSFWNPFQSNITTGKEQRRTEPFSQFKKTQQGLSLTDSFGKEIITSCKEPYPLQNTNGKRTLQSVNKNATSASLYSWMDSKYPKQKKREMDLQDKGRNYQKTFNLSGSLHNEKMHSQTIGYTTNVNHYHSLHRNNNKSMSNFNRKELLHSELESNEAMALTVGYESRNTRKESLPFSNLYYSQNLQTQEMLSSRSKRPNHSFNKSINDGELGMNMEEKEERYSKEQEEPTKQRNALTLQQKIQKDIPRLIRSTMENHLNHSLEQRIENITEQKMTQYLSRNANQIIQQNLQEFNTEEIKTQISEYVSKEMETHGKEIKEEKIKEAEHKIEEEINKNLQAVSTELKEKVHQEIQEEVTNKVHAVYSNVKKRVEEQLNTHVTNHSVRLQNSLHKSMNDELKRKTDIIQNNIQNKLNTQLTRELIRSVESLHDKINEHISKEVKKNVQCISSNVEEYTEKQINHKMQFMQMHLKDIIRDELTQAMNGMERKQIEQHQEIEKHIICDIENKCKEYMNVFNIYIKQNAQEFQERIQNEIKHMTQKNVDNAQTEFAYKVESLKEELKKLHEDKNMSKEVEEIVEKKQNQMFEYLDVMKTCLEETNENKFHFWTDEINKRITDMNTNTKEDIKQVIHKETLMNQEIILENLKNSMALLFQKEMKTSKNEKRNHILEMQDMVRPLIVNMNKTIFNAIDDNTVAILNSKESLSKHITDCVTKVTKSNGISNFKEEQKEYIEMQTNFLDEWFKKMDERSKLQESRMSEMKQQMETETKKAYDKIYVFLKGAQESLDKNENKLQTINKEEFTQIIKTEITNVMKEEIAKQIKSGLLETFETNIKEMIMYNKEPTKKDPLFTSECGKENQDTTKEESNEDNAVSLSQVQTSYDILRNFINEYMVTQNENITKTLERIVRETAVYQINTTLLDRFEKIEDTLKNEIIQTNMHMREKERNPTEVIQTLFNELRKNQEVMIQSIIHKLDAFINQKKKKRKYMVRGPKGSYKNSLNDQISKKDFIEPESKIFHTVSNSENLIQTNIEMKEGVHEKEKPPFVVTYVLDEQNRLVEISKCSETSTVTKLYM